MKLKKYSTLAAIFLTVSASSQAATVFTDTFNYSVDNAMIAEGGWTAATGNGGSDAGSGVYWGNGSVLEYNYATSLTAGDVLTMDATLNRTAAKYHYTMTLDLWDGADAGTRVQADTSDQAGSSNPGGVLSQLSYTVTPADIAAGRNHVVFQYSHSADWGETKDVTLSVTAVPEPSSAALLGLGGLALILHRRK